MEYPKAVKDEILSILRDQIENNREPGDSYAQITAKFGVSRKLIYGWKTDLKKRLGAVNRSLQQLQRRPPLESSIQEPFSVFHSSPQRRT